MIHLVEPTQDGCIAAVVNSINYLEPRFGVTTLRFGVTIFSPHGAKDDAARRGWIRESDFGKTWHDPIGCVRSISRSPVLRGVPGRQEDHP